MSKLDIIDFNVMDAPLEDTNLIEASAGTGKTYSLALLALRLVLEKDIPVERILMVTFTRDATAELEDRIRHFIRHAHDYSLGGSIENKDIMRIVDSMGKDTASTTLAKAVESLDILAVMTIHSFCEKSLSAFPFETGQPFRFEVVEEIDRLREQVVNDYWRKKVTTLDKELFEEFSKTLNRKAINEVLIKALDGREYIAVKVDEDILDQVKKAYEPFKNALQKFDTHIHVNFDSIKNTPVTNRYAESFKEKYFISENEMKKGFEEKITTKYIEDFFPAEKELCEDYLNKKDEFDSLSKRYAYTVFTQAINDLKDKVTNLKAQKQVIDYDDQINFLHKAVMEGTAQEVLSEQYDAVFIDEFQDTDKKQYEIFHTLYSNKILFYIGDPKQSIYGWRKADMNTYKKAREEVNTVYGMNVNYRSTPGYVNALNSFFSSNNPFNDPDIEYKEVRSSSNGEDTLTYNGLPVQNPLKFYQFDNQDQIKTFTANAVAELIADEHYQINGRVLTFSDITIIVRKNYEGKGIRNALTKLNIPSVTLDGTKVFQSDEAEIVRYIMVAAINPSRKNINRAILGGATGIGIRSLVRVDENEQLDKFIRLKETWAKDGIYAMISRFMVLYNVRHNCLNMGTQGKRILTNIQHIAEVLHRYEYQNKKTPTELLEWFSMGSDESSEDFEQRIESQDNAVKIVTIHKSKGLTFGIVLAPYLDLKPRRKDRINIYEFRDEQGAYKFTHQPNEGQEKLFRQQEDQENRRLIYVALTRAKYKSIVVVSGYRFNQTCLNKFTLPAFEEVDEKMATQLREPLQIDSTTTFTAKPAPNLLVKNQFGIHSYSALSRAHYSFPFELEVLGDEKSYDQFIFQDLARGAKVGTAVHSIFERLDFANPSGWDQTILDASKYYPNIIKQPNGSEGELGNLHHFAQMVEHVMYANIELNGTTFSLAQVGKNQMLPELEFYFAIDRVNKTEIDKYLGEDAKLTGEADLQGLMTGFVDLLFEHKGKYYIADWKTNHLGNSVEHYNTQGVEQAMLGSNYHLQYMIYTIAVVRWLRHRIKDFSYEKHFGGIIYLFLRGIRKGESTGIYVNRPKEEDILNLDKAFYSSQG